VTYSVVPESCSVAPKSVDGNKDLNSDSSSGKFVFGSVSSNFQVFCNFLGQYDPSSMASTIASIFSNLKEDGGSYFSVHTVRFLCRLFYCF
jgi:hypothetical protein